MALFLLTFFCFSLVYYALIIYHISYHIDIRLQYKKFTRRNNAILQKYFAVIQAPICSWRDQFDASL